MFKSVKDFDVKDKTVLVRVDFNVPLQDGKVSDDNRILQALPTIEYLRAEGAKIVLMSHLGRPKGKPDPTLSLAPVAVRLGELLEMNISVAPDCIGSDVKAQVDALQPGEILLLENLRFHSQEQADDDAFAAALASLADLYVNDAFGAAHRAHASTHGVATRLPAAAGLLMEKELVELGRLLDEPKRPFVAILGGAKVTDKIGVLDNLSKLADVILIGGGMAFTFLKLEGHEIGRSLCEKDLEACGQLWERAKAGRATIHLPTDVAVAKEIAEGSERQEVAVDSIPSDTMGLDIGAATIETFASILKTAGTVVWNGPMGVFEVSPFDKGTLEVARAVANSDAISCVGGGDSAAAVRQMNLADKITHVSTGGGASLEMLEGKELPGVAVLKATSKA